MKKKRILVADDEPRYVYLARINLEARGYEVLVAEDGARAVELAASAELDLVVLDIKMPGLDGLEVCRRIRQFSPAPIIMLTAVAGDADKVDGLDAGADDYVTKPFSMDEFLARVRAALRRAERSVSPGEGAVIEAGELRVDLAQQRVYTGGQEVALTPTEYSLLCELARNRGRVLTSDHLLEAIWGAGYEGDYRVLRQAIYRLRLKIEPEPGDPRYVLTRSGVGYVFDASV